MLTYIVYHKFQVSIREFGYLVQRVRSAQAFASMGVWLLDARGACGSHTHVLGRLLQRADIQIRIAQVKCDEDQWGCHIVLEAKLDGNFVVLDPLFDLVFEKEDGSLASFEEVGDDWEYFERSLPSNYNRMFAYADVRYTNWNKIPILMPIAKKVLRFFMGDDVETMSIRAGVLNLYKAYTAMAVIAYFIHAFFSIIFVRRTNKKKNIRSNHAPEISE